MKVEMDEGRETRQEERLSPQEPSRPASAWVRWLVVLLTLGAVAGIVAAGILPRVKAKKALEAETLDMATRRVAVIRPKRGAPAQEVILPANIQAFTDAPIYARTNGYLKRWHADIGARVKSGQLLAEIDTPEVEQQLEQARADLATAEANYRLAEITATRYKELLKTNSVAQQDADNAVGSADAKKAGLDSARFNVRRLEELQSFNKIYAPFDGVITARNTDIGQLIDSGSGGGPARELYHIAAVSQMRVYVNVPQAYSRAAQPGLPASLILTEFPGRSFQGVLVRTANSIDAAARTLLTEIDVANPTGEILPGAYGEVHLKLPAVAPTYLLPISTLLFRSNGLQVAVVREGGRVELVPVTLGRDFGAEAEVLGGFNGDEAVVLNVPDSIASGEKVEVIQPENKKDAKE